jgi:Erv1 / Alr family
MILGFYPNKHTKRMITMNRIQSPTSSTMNSFLTPLASNSRKAMKQLLQQSHTTKSSEMKLSWGQPTWYLFHTLAEKVSEEHFQTVRIGLLNIIYSICINLPCPSCANHAKTYLDHINFNRIQTKEQLQKILWEFHNHVNQRKQYPIFSYEDLTPKYSQAILRNIILSFMTVFSQKTKSIRLIADDMKRTMILQTVREWIQSNIQYFQHTPESFV